MGKKTKQNKNQKQKGRAPLLGLAKSVYYRCNWTRLEKLSITLWSVMKQNVWPLRNEFISWDEKSKQWS